MHSAPTARPRGSNGSWAGLADPSNRIARLVTVSAGHCHYAPPLDRWETGKKPAIAYKA